jgi:hypothetical protein
MATRSPPTALVPPLPGWPLAGTPGCLLMALVGAATRRDWNGAGMGLCAGGAAARSDRYWDFTEATRRLGFRAMLTAHRCGHDARLAQRRRQAHDSDAPQR